MKGQSFLFLSLCSVSIGSALTIVAPDFQTLFGHPRPQDTHQFFLDSKSFFFGPNRYDYDFI